MMQKRLIRKNNSLKDINLTSYADLVFNLLFVFMVASTSVMMGGVKIDLPKGKAEIIVIKKEPLAVTIKKDGSIYVEKNQIKLSNLMDKLNEITGFEKDVKIFVLADKDIPYHRVLNVVSVIYGGGYFDVTLVTELQRL
jgi:biopolymer transport protein ExbD